MSSVEILGSDVTGDGESSKDVVVSSDDDDVNEEDSPLFRKIGNKAVREIESGNVERRFSLRIKKIRESEEEKRISGGSSGREVENQMDNVEWEEDVIAFDGGDDEDHSSNGGSEGVVNMSDEARVKETLRIFNKYSLLLIREEEKRCGLNNSGAGETSKTKKRKCQRPDLKALTKKRKCQRPDLKALTKMKDQNKILYPHKRFGHLPGIHVGHQFFSRTDMVALGLHNHWLRGIDYVGKCGTDQVHFL